MVEKILVLPALRRCTLEIAFVFWSCFINNISKKERGKNPNFKEIFSVLVPGLPHQARRWQGPCGGVTWLWEVVSWLTQRECGWALAVPTPLLLSNLCRSLLGGQGEAQILPSQRLQTCQSSAGRSCFLSCVLLGTGVKSWTGTLNLANETPGMWIPLPFGKITNRSCQRVTLKEGGFCNSPHPITYVFLVQKMLLCLWEIMPKGLERRAFPYSSSQPRGQQEAFVSKLVPLAC